jgi:hypothetical protein
MVAKTLKKYLRLRFVFSIILSLLMVFFCLLIVVLKILYPYHRILAISLYFLSWAVYIIPFLRRSSLRKICKKPRFCYLWKNLHIIIGTVFFLFFLYLLIVFVPIKSVILNENQKIVSLEQIDDDILYVTELIISLEKHEEQLFNSGLLDINIDGANPDKITELKDHFCIILDHIIALERLIEFYKYFYQIDSRAYPDIHEKTFLIAYSAYAAKFKIVSDLADKIDNNDFVNTVLNEKMCQFNKTYMYLRLKTSVTDPENILRMHLGRVYLTFMSERLQKYNYLIFYSQDAYRDVFGGFNRRIFQNTDAILDMFEEKALNRWLPVQKSIAISMSQMHILYRDSYLITPMQIEEMISRLEPGDIMVQRRNWKVSNAGMPGFWTHSAIYVGTFEELDTYFADVSYDMFNSSVSEYVKNNYPLVYEEKMKITIEGYIPLTIEGKADGIIMLPMEISGLVDYIGAIRPNLTKERKLSALLYTFDNYLVPYDYNFDFQTDDALLCSELIYKAYKPREGMDGLNYSLDMIAGRYILSPYAMIKQFDEKYGTDQEQNDFVFFFDGNEDLGIAIEKNVTEFKETWKRSKYDFMSLW